jgi:tetratricopeptide (TPR) repeat protein
MPIQRKHDLKAWIGREDGLLATATHTWPLQGDLAYHVVRYAVPGLRHTLADAIADPDPAVRIAHATSFLQTLPSWWERLAAPILPLPADVVFTQDGAPRLLALPPWRLPDVDGVFREPLRALFLAPELVRARTDLAWNDPDHRRNIDRYAAGVSLLLCFRHRPPVKDIDHALRLAAIGIAAHPSRLEGNLPFWLEQLAATQEAIRAIQRLLSPDPRARATVDLGQLVKLLDGCRQRMSPEIAVDEVRQRKTAMDAYRLLHDILLELETYELLLRGGELALELARPLEAIDLFERAIATEPERPEAYGAQLKIIASAASNPGALRDVFLRRGAVGAKLETKLWRDFERLDPDGQEECELPVAVFLLWRGQQLSTAYTSAAEFIHPRLYDAGGKFHWWKFGLNLAYAEALLGQDRVDAAHEQLGIIKQGLRKSKANDLVLAAEITRHGEWVLRIEQRIVARKKEQGR